jgi:zinc/manganese transport system substrate-binding protein
VSVLVPRRALLTGLAAGALATSAPAWGATNPLPVLATFSILADIVARVGGAQVRVDTLVGANEDAHHFDLRPSDLRKIAATGLLVRLGLGFDNWVERYLAPGGRAPPQAIASSGVPTIALRPGVPDPHIWQGFSTLTACARTIEAALATIRPADRAGFSAGRARFEAQIAAVERDARAAMAQVPAGRRIAIVPHNSFRYLGRALNVEFVALSSVSTGGQPSAAAVAALTRIAREARVAAVFSENVADTRLATAIARQTGLRLAGRLYSDALSAPDGPAASVPALLRANAMTLAAGLRA